MIPRAAHAAGAAILRVASRLMKLLSVAGTAAMFLVGGGIHTHGVPASHRVVENAREWFGAHAGALPGVLEWFARSLRISSSGS